MKLTGTLLHGLLILTQQEHQTAPSVQNTNRPLLRTSY